ncbi:hypothetical protein MOKP106_32710 [Mycobacterium avium subsp. hominissuis]|uniref:hypothetical protein n=1 Tax=Mycobacterium avium TaxID=1764 RepID=UPI001E3CB10E|nr:hypothetical protein [Mycobacterium avium]
MSMPVDSVVLAGHGLPALPPAREFVTSAGFGGAAALVAALLLAAVIAFALRRASKRDRLQREQQEHHFQQVRDAERHSGAVERCWQRLVWVVETAGIEPASSQAATLGLGPELALELLRGLLRDAENLGDDTLAGAVTVYLNQFSLVIAQQSGPLSTFAVPAVTTAADEEQPAPDSQTPSPAATDETRDGAKKVAVSGRRRRR